MRVVYVQPAEHFGGAERQAVLAMKLLPEFGVEVIPVLGPGDQIQQALQRAGVHDYIFSPEFPAGFEGPAPFPDRVQRVAKFVRSYQHLREQIARIAEQHDADLIFASRPFGWTVGGAAAGRVNRPVVWRAGGRTTTAHQRMWIRIANTLYRPTALVSNCQAVADSIHPLLSCESFLVPNGVDTDRFDPRRVIPWRRTEYGIRNDPVVGVVARPAPEKGFDALLLTMRKLVSRVPGVQLLIAGDYPWRDHYEREFQRTMHGCVRFLGHTEEVERFYAICDVVCLPSRQRSNEGSSNAILEAMAMQRAVVATDVGGVRDLITHGVHGFLASPDDPEGMAHYLEVVLGSASLRLRMGSAGRSTVTERHSARRAAQDLAEVLRSVSERSRGVRETRERVVPTIP